MVANNLCKELDETEWEITIIDKDEKHHFQSGYLFIPFGVYAKQDVLNKCPIAPLEFVLMADWFFTVNGIRD